MLNTAEKTKKGTHRQINMREFLVKREIIEQLDSLNFDGLQRLADVHRINCLAGLKAASHGWLGTCFSSMELMTCIYHKYIQKPLEPLANRGALHVSKGHAAMAQYAILAALGCFEIDKLLSYKQRDGLPAHCDRTVPGVDSDSGSLGQGLSKALGNAISNNVDGGEIKPVFAVMGDGELQEGQIFEALLSAVKQNPRGLIPIIDRNGLQSDSQTRDIKDAKDWAQVFAGIGFKVFDVDGHDVRQIVAAIDEVLGCTEPCIIIANTFKGGGTSLTSMSHETPRREGVWHGQVPTDEQYFAMLEELVGRVALPALSEAFEVFAKSFEAVEVATAKPTALSTGEAFTKYLEAYAQDADVFVLDADLEKACKLARVADLFGERFIEMGISEQDMVSVAAGLGLTGKIAVVNTYGAFFRRGLDQIFAAATEGVPVIFAGHYSGIDYFSDGKSHQAVNDVGLMRCIGDIEIVEPVCEASTKGLLDWSIEKLKREYKEKGRCRPVYFRLHRTGCPDLSLRDRFKNEGTTKLTCYSLCMFEGGFEDNKGLLLVNGPHMLNVALKAQDQLKKDGVSLDVMSVLRYSDELKLLKEIMKTYKNVFTLEDHRRETGLGGFVANLEYRNPVRIGVRNYCQSSLCLGEMIQHHGISVDDVCKVVRKVYSCDDHK